MDGDLEHFRRLSYIESRIPRLDALEVFVPTGAENDQSLREVIRRTGFSRWFPVERGHRVVILYEGGGYDAGRFSLVKGGWDHEHCKRCQRTIDAMTHCWVAEEGPYTILCDQCHGEVVDEPPGPA